MLWSLVQRQVWVSKKPQFKVGKVRTVMELSDLTGPSS